MMGIMIQTAFLVIAILAVQKLFGNKLHAYMRYSLWLLVVLRLIIPVNFIDSPFSMLRFAEAANRQESPLKDILQPASVEISMENVSFTENTEKIMSDEAGITGTISKVRHGIWLTGCLFVGGFFGFSYFRFRRRLCKTRVAYKKGLLNTIPKTGVPVYRVKGLETPCLVGLFHPTIYIGTDIDTVSDYFRYTVTHEEVHYMHMDHIWAVVRAVLVIVYWFNPFVWAAAALSARDGEIACDYGTVRRLGKEERFAYGEMLLVLSKTSRRRRIYSCGTMLRPRKTELKERILRLTQKNDSRVWAGVLAVFIMIIPVGCAFTGKSDISGGKTFLLVNEADEPQSDYPGSIEPKPEEVSGATFLNVDEPQLTIEDGIPTQEDAAGFPYSSPYDIHNMVEIIYDEPCVYNRVSDAFGERIHPITGEVRVHDGIDYAAAEGTSIVAAADGEVYETGYSAEHGNYVVLLHMNGDMTYYCHCREIATKEGEQVKRGDKIATVGKTGQATGSFLHFALSRDGKFINPQEHMRAE